jgi:hypothetical protein
LSRFYAEPRAWPRRPPPILTNAQWPSGVLKRNGSRSMSRCR